MDKTQLTDAERRTRMNVRNFLLPASTSELLAEIGRRDEAGDHFGARCAAELLVEKLAEAREPRGNRVVRAHEAWTLEHSRRARREGWSLFDRCGPAPGEDADSESLVALEIQRIDCPEEFPDEDIPRFESDAQAVDAAVAGASRGDATALLAIYLDGRPAHAPVVLPTWFHLVAPVSEPPLEVPRGNADPRGVIADAINGLREFYPCLNDVGVSNEIAGQVHVQWNLGERARYESVHMQVENLAIGHELRLRGEA